MRRFLRIGRLLVVLAMLAGLAAAAGWLLLRGSLPHYTGTVHSAAVQQAVQVERDVRGTVTLRGSNRADLDWALGYVHAQERFFQMDLLRRRAAGELAELFGPAALPADRAARPHRMRARLQAAVARLPQDQRARIERYRDGVKAGLDALGVRPFPYLLVRSPPAAWRNEDTLLVVAAMAFTLNDSRNRRELAFSRMQAALPASAFDFLTASGGRWDAPLDGEALVWPAPPRADELDLRAGAARAAPGPAAASTPADDRYPGSNAFAVAGALAGGAALVADDMHLELGVPSLWFRTRLVYPDPRDATVTLQVTGASLPGAPALVVGSNGRIAWGFTNSGVDSADWVRVIADPADADRYRAPDGFTRSERHLETIHVRGAADELLEVRETLWGPILARDADGTALALAWTAQEPGAIDLHLQQMELARNLEEGMTVAQASGIPPQNLVIGDREGNIAWTIAGRIPARAGGFDPRLPADWSAAGSGWQGWIPAQALPRVVNPPSGRIWSANQRHLGGAALAQLGDGGYDLGARAGQIRDDLAARPAFTPADFLAIQLDDRALFLEHWKDLLARTLAQAPRTPARAATAQVLADWNGHASIDSVAYRLVRAWRSEVMDAVLDGFAARVRQRFPDFSLPKLPQAEHAVWMLLEQRPQHLLPPAFASWDALLLDRADRVEARLAAQPGGLAARTWGERNTTRIAHPMSRALPAFAARWLDMPAQPLPGDSNMPRVQAPAFGASERFAVAPGDEANGYFMMPGGQSGHPLSPYYGAGHADWAQGRPTPFLPGPAEALLEFVPE